MTFSYSWKAQTFVIMPMITLYLHLAKLEEVTRKLQNDFLILDERFFNNFLVRSLRLLLKKCKDDFQDLLRSSGDISIDQRCINSLLTELYKFIHGLSPEIMNEVFYTRANIYNTRQFNVFKTHISTSNRYGLNSIPYKANQLWNLLPENQKSSPPLTLFKSKTKLGQCFNCL